MTDARPLRSAIRQRYFRNPTGQTAIIPVVLNEAGKPIIEIAEDYGAEFFALAGYTEVINEYDSSEEQPA